MRHAIHTLLLWYYKTYTDEQKTRIWLQENGKQFEKVRNFCTR